MTEDYEEIFQSLEDAKEYIIASNHFLNKIRDMLYIADSYGASTNDLSVKLRGIRLELGNRHQLIAQRQMSGNLKERSDKNEDTIQN